MIGYGRRLCIPGIAMVLRPFSVVSAFPSPRRIELRSSHLLMSRMDYTGVRGYGLQGMSSSDAEVRDLLRVLTAKIEMSREPLDAQAVGNALYGLQGMSSSDSEVRDLLRVLTAKIEMSTEPLDALPEPAAK
ncbi:hypothetical protein B484DRAFT_399523 [Ochromonadaceae sp. CCMP2298]|nr:hypothetical protein B484DRAFT_399523 [Ochromonadaceae sp. CCMP2298]